MALHADGFDIDFFASTSKTVSTCGQSVHRGRVRRLVEFMFEFNFKPVSPRAARLRATYFSQAPEK